MIENVLPQHGMLFWISFNLFILAAIGIDLFLLSKKGRNPSYKQALFESVAWLLLALIFGCVLFKIDGYDTAMAYFTGYAIEKSLSLDNVMVFAVIFQALAIPVKYQRRVLHWGILSALIMRMAMILGGVILLNKFHFLIYFFGALLIYTGIKLFSSAEHEKDITQTFLWRLIGKKIPMTKELDGERFLSYDQNSKKIKATPLLVALILIEVSDVIFAVDSIPAVYAITSDPFIIYTSNVFAILGLRALYFLLAGAMESFKYLKKGLAFILCFVGVKMLGLIKLEPAYSLAIIVLILAGSILSSYLSRTNRNE